MILTLVTASLAFSVLYYVFYLPAEPSFARSLVKGLPGTILAATILIYSDCPTIGAAFALFAMVDIATSRRNWSLIAVIGLNMAGCFLTGLTFLNIIESDGAELTGFEIAILVLLASAVLAMNITHWRHFGEQNVAITAAAIIGTLLVASGLFLPQTFSLTSIAIVAFVASALSLMRETFAAPDLATRLFWRRITWPLYYGGVLMIAIDFLPSFWNTLS